jgi:hypothetical protein
MADALPMPLAAPETTATFPDRSKSGGGVWFIGPVAE